jgi:hypothetical protein
MGIHPLYWLNQLACGQGFCLLETTEGEVRELLPGYPCLFLRAIPLAMWGGPLISTQCPHCKSYEGLLGSPTWAELELLSQDQGTQLPENPSHPCPVGKERTPQTDCSPHGHTRQEAGYSLWDP